MTTLEQIMRDVTPPETWQLDVETASEQIVDANGKLIADFCILGPGFDSKTNQARAQFVLRASKNFAPLVKALEKLLECSAIVHACNQCANEANDVLAEALRKET